MLRFHRLPGLLIESLEAFRPGFTAPTFMMFALLAAGLVARPGGRTVCGMLAGAGRGVASQRRAPDLRLRGVERG